MASPSIDKSYQHFSHRHFSDLSPLANAFSSESLEVAELLLQNGADIYDESSNVSVLEVAITRDVEEPPPRSFKRLQLLLNHGLDLHDGDLTRKEWGIRSALLFFPIKSGLLEFLIKKGFDINHVNEYGHSILHNCALSQLDVDVDLFKHLIDCGANIKAMTPRGTTIFQMIEQGFKERVRIRGVKTCVIEFVDLTKIAAKETLRINKQIIKVLTLERRFTKESPFHESKIPEEMFEMLLKIAGLFDVPLLCSKDIGTSNYAELTPIRSNRGVITFPSLKDIFFY